MIRHMVLTRFRADVPAKERLSIFAQLAALEGVTPGWIKFHAGEDASPEALNKGFAHGFCVDFKDEKARDAYLAHEDHKVAGARLVAALDAGLEGLLVFDLEL
mgnify:CR=1 FL=1